MSLPKIMVMGVGNVLLSDEGLGVQFLTELEDAGLTDNVELLEGGTSGMDLIYLIQEVDFLIIVDAVNAHAEPGALFRFSPGKTKIFPDEFQVSFHQVGIVEILSLADIVGKAPKSMEWSIGLTPEIQVVMPKLKQHVLDEISYINEHGEFRPTPENN